MTIDTERIRDAAEVLDTLTSQLPTGHPLRADVDARAKNCVAALYSAADAIDAQQAEIDRHRRAAGRWKKVAESAEGRVRDHAAEIAEAKGQIEYLDRQNDGLRRACAALEADRDRLLNVAQVALAWSDSDWVGYETVKSAVECRTRTGTGRQR